MLRDFEPHLLAVEEAQLLSPRFLDEFVAQDLVRQVVPVAAAVALLGPSQVLLDLRVFVGRLQAVATVFE